MSSGPVNRFIIVVLLFQIHSAVYSSVLNTATTSSAASPHLNAAQFKAANRLQSQVTPYAAPDVVISNPSTMLSCRAGIIVYYAKGKLKTPITVKFGSFVLADGLRPSNYSSVLCTPDSPSTRADSKNLTISVTGTKTVLYNQKAMRNLFIGFRVNQLTITRTPAVIVTVGQHRFTTLNPHMAVISPSNSKFQWPLTCASPLVVPDFVGKFACVIPTLKIYPPFGAQLQPVFEWQRYHLNGTAAGISKLNYIQEGNLTYIGLVTKFPSVLAKGQNQVEIRGHFDATQNTTNYRCEFDCPAWENRTAVTSITASKVTCKLPTEQLEKFGSRGVWCSIRLKMATNANHTAWARFPDYGVKNQWKYKPAGFGYCNVKGCMEAHGWEDPMKQGSCEKEAARAECYEMTKCTDSKYLLMCTTATVLCPNFKCLKMQSCPKITPKAVDGEWKCGTHTCNLTCHTGFHANYKKIPLSTPSGAWCDFTTGKWVFQTNSTVPCLAARCRPLPLVNGGTWMSAACVARDTGGVKDGQTCHLSCSKGYTSHPPNAVTTCTAGQWSTGHNAYCVASKAKSVCQALPSAVPNGLWKPWGCITGKSREGTNCRLHCYTGYQLTKGELGTSTCKAGNWTNDAEKWTCGKSLCVAPASVPKGKWSCSWGLVNSTDQILNCKLQCTTGFQASNPNATATCLPGINGTFTWQTKPNQTCIPSAPADSCTMKGGAKYCKHGNCTLRFGSAMCVCPHDWTGKQCEVYAPGGLCKMVCHNGGTCQARFGTEVCKCTTGWHGQFCNETKPKPTPTCSSSKLRKCVVGFSGNKTDNCGFNNYILECALKNNCTQIVMLWCQEYFKQTPHCYPAKCYSVHHSCHGSVNVYQNCFNYLTLHKAQYSTKCSWTTAVANCAREAGCQQLQTTTCGVAKMTCQNNHQPLNTTICPMSPSTSLLSDMTEPHDTKLLTELWLVGPSEQTEQHSNMDGSFSNYWIVAATAMPALAGIGLLFAFLLARRTNAQVETQVV